MSQPGKPDLPERRPAASPPARNLSSQELEAVIRRAVELQAGPAGRDEGVSDTEVVRIGQELGLEPSAVRRAIVEVRSRPPEDRGVLGRSMGPALVRAARVLRRPAAATGLLIEQYLRESELMVVQRRFPDRTRYHRDSSLAANLTRMARGFTRTGEPLNLKQLDVGVAAMDPDNCLVEISVDMGGDRAGFAAGGLTLGGLFGGGMAVSIWATPVADPLMLLGIPVFAAAWYGMKAAYRGQQRSTQEKLESFLDRLEHNELKSR